MVFGAQTDLGRFRNSVASPPSPCAPILRSWGLQVTVWDLLPYSAPHKQMRTSLRRHYYMVALKKEALESMKKPSSE